MAPVSIGGRAGAISRPLRPRAGRPPRRDHPIDRVQRHLDQGRVAGADIEVVAVRREADHQVGHRVEQRPLSEFALAVEADQQRQRDRRRREAPGGEQESAWSSAGTARVWSARFVTSTAIRTDAGDQDGEQLRRLRAGATNHRRRTTTYARPPTPGPRTTAEAPDRSRSARDTRRIALFAVVPIARITTVTRSSRVSSQPSWIGEDERDEADEHDIRERNPDLVHDGQVRRLEVADEPRKTDEGHQAAGSICRPA